MVKRIVAAAAFSRFYASMYRILIGGFVIYVPFNAQRTESGARDDSVQIDTADSGGRGRPLCGQHHSACGWVLSKLSGSDMWV